MSLRAFARKDSDGAARHYADETSNAIQVVQGWPKVDLRAATVLYGSHGGSELAALSPAEFSAVYRLQRPAGIVARPSRA